MIDEIINNINQEINNEKPEPENKQPENKQPEPEPEQRKKIYKLSDITDIDTVAYISADLLNWINAKLIISGYNKLILKLPNFDSNKYKQTDNELNNNKNIIRELIKDIELDSKTLIKVLFILSLGKNFESPYKQLINDIKANKNVKNNINNNDHHDNYDNNTDDQFEEANKEAEIIKFENRKTKNININDKINNDIHEQKINNTEGSNKRNTEHNEKKNINESLKNFFKKNKKSDD